MNIRRKKKKFYCFRIYNFSFYFFLHNPFSSLLLDLNISEFDVWIFLVTFRFMGRCKKWKFTINAHLKLKVNSFVLFFSLIYYLKFEILNDKRYSPKFLSSNFSGCLRIRLSLMLKSCDRNGWKCNFHLPSPHFLVKTLTLIV